jgi:hypothetical protein
LILGLGLAEWLTIAALVGALLLTFRVMTKAALHYDKARRARERREAAASNSKGQG